MEKFGLLLQKQVCFAFEFKSGNFDEFLFRDFNTFRCLSTFSPTIFHFDLKGYGLAICSRPKKKVNIILKFDTCFLFNILMNGIRIFVDDSTELMF